MGMWGEVVDDTKGKARLITTITVFCFFAQQNFTEKKRQKSPMINGCFWFP